MFYSDTLRARQYKLFSQIKIWSNRLISDYFDLDFTTLSRGKFCNYFQIIFCSRVSEMRENTKISTQKKLGQFLIKHL